MTTFRSKNENWFLSIFLRSFVKFEEADEDKKFINPKGCIREKFHLQKVGVTEVFLRVKVVLNFEFGHFLFLHTTEEGAVEDKKFISPKRFIREKFGLQKVGVTEVFLLVKVVSDFDFGHFLENWLQRHLVGNVLWTNQSSGHNQ